MRKRFLFVSIFCLIFSAVLMAQNAASVIWPLTDPAAGGTGISPVISGSLKSSDETLNNMEINQYSGFNNSQRIRIAGNAWPANQTTQIDSVYIQFAVTAPNGIKFYVDSISLNIVEISINTIKANIYYSKDSTFADSAKLSYSTKDTNGYLNRDTFSVVNAAISDTLNPGETIYLRIYPWVEDPAVRTGKYIGLQDVKISGTVENLPLPSSVMWPLTDPGSGGTGLTPVTSGGVKGEDELLVNTEINQYSGPSSSQRVRIAGNAWPANQTTQIDTVYVQFQAAPKFGGTFTVDSISLGIAGVSINTMKANIYYSTDSAFTSNAQINYSTGDTSGNNYLGRDSLLFVHTSLNAVLNTGESIYLRIYPWVDNDPAVRTGKYIAIKNVVISGTASGVTADPPTVATTPPDDIATTFVTSGGNISTDGGFAVTARGVVWDTASSPTISKSKTLDGKGTGTFVSHVTGLIPGTKYYLRAYATNDAGTSYGDEFTFTTLDSTEVPMVTTAPVTKILVKTAESGGNVTAWGGDTVTARGVVWNTQGNPTLSDNKTTNGKGIGSFTSILYPLEGNTIYYVRAYATNSKGTGYGAVDTFKTQTQAPPVTKVVASDGSGDYTTVQAAFDGVPDNYTGPYTIFVKKGIYHEKLLLKTNKVNVILKGEDRDSTILEYNDYAGIAGGTSGSYSVGIDAPDFTAINITFQNTVKNDQSVSNQQAVALRSNGDRQVFYNCKLLGYQDTYYAWGGSGAGRVYMKNCYIEGSVDFIFGRDIVLFDSCELHVNRNQCSITAASTDADSKFGFVFKNCTISYDSLGFDGNAINKIYLGRAWQSKPRTVFLNSYEPSVIDSLGWNQQPINSGVIPALYGVYQDSGPGFNTVGHAQGIGTILNSTEAADYTMENIFSKNSNPAFAYDWIPVSPVTSIKDDQFINQIPASYHLYQNYPNPFNPSTTIRYSIPQNSHVKIVLFDVLGRETAELVNEIKNPGNYTVRFNASSLASGVYFYRIEATHRGGKAGNFVQVKKMMLIK